MQKLKNKLRSQRGASLSIALLLFLVCAVVGSVVLTAGTAASGRLAKLAESEQRYYAVNSAAELLKDQLCGEKNRIVIIYDEEYDQFTVESYDGTVITPSTKTLASDLATYLVFGTLDIDAADNKEKFDKAVTEALATCSFSLPFTFTGAEEIAKALKVDVKAYFKDATLTLYISNETFYSQLILNWNRVSDVSGQRSFIPFEWSLNTFKPGMSAEGGT